MGQIKTATNSEMDFILNGKGSGPLAQRLLANGMNVGAMRPWVGNDGRAYINVNGQASLVTNATLRKDEWKQYDEAALQMSTERLVGISDLLSRGLTYNISNGLGTTVLEYEDVSDLQAAQMSMDAVTRGTNDRPEFDINYLPLPIIHKDFQSNIRVLNASRTTGQPLDTTTAGLAGRKVAELLEQYLFQGASTYTYGGGTLYGYMDSPTRNTGSLTANWDDSAATGDTILTDVRAMKQALIDAKHYGPYVLYIPTNFETAIDDDFKANSDKTIRQRLLEINGISDVKVADKLTDDNVIMVQMTSDVVRLVVGLPVTTVEWQTEGGMIFHYKVMTIQVPQVRADQDDNSGIAHWS